jgi:CRP/FNR family transcriptional regulator, cyclic AMP receptor protein
MQTLQPVLAAHPFFAGLPERYLELITKCAMNVRYAAGEYLFREGDPAMRFWIVREGAVALEIHAPEQGTLTIETIEGGEVLGWSWLFPPYRWHFDARAVRPVRAVAFDGACLRARCETDHELGYELMRRFAQVIVERLQATRLQLLDVYSDPMRGKVSGRMRGNVGGKVPSTTH